MPGAFLRQLRDPILRVLQGRLQRASGREMTEQDLVDPGTKLILVVDDDEDVRSFLETILEMDGYQVQTAADGKEALAKVQARAPDLVITDLMMPESGGYEVLRGLQGGENSRLPIIVNTARQLDASTEEMIRAEANVVEF